MQFSWVFLIFISVKSNQKIKIYNTQETTLQPVIK